MSQGPWALESLGRRLGEPIDGDGHGLDAFGQDLILIRHIRGMRSSSKSAWRQLNGRMEVTVVVHSVPGLSVRCGTLVARPVRTNALTMPEDCVERLS
jgi:hypothetical protein